MRQSEATLVGIQSITFVYMCSALPVLSSIAGKSLSQDKNPSGQLGTLRRTWTAHYQHSRRYTFAFMVAHGLILAERGLGIATQS